MLLMPRGISPVAFFNCYYSTGGGNYSAGVSISTRQGRMFRLLFSHPRLLSPPPALPECASAVAEADTAKDVRLCFLKFSAIMETRAGSVHMYLSFQTLYMKNSFGRTLNYAKIRNVYEQPSVQICGFSYPFSFQDKSYVCLQDQI